MRDDVAEGSGRLGTVCLVFGAIAAAAFVCLWALTLPHFNPPNWIRILGVVGLPIGLVTSVTTGILGRRGRGRCRIVTGLSLSALTRAAFVVLVSTAE